MSRSRLIVVGSATLVVLVDQLSKWWALRALANGRRIQLIGDTLELRLLHNAGSAFGLLPVKTIVITAFSLVVLGVVTVWVLRTPFHPVVMGLVIGGGLGNIVDRLVRPPAFLSGRVVDFIALDFWPTFNLADSAIVIGVGLLLVTSSGNNKGEPEPDRT